MKPDELLDGLESRFEKLQKELYMNMTKSYLSQLEVEGDIIKFSERNLQATAEVERIVNEFTRKTTPVFKWYVKRLIDVTGATEASYKSTATVEQLQEAKHLVRGITDKLGVDEKGNIIQGGLISRLSSLDTVRRDITNYLLQEVSVGRSFGELLKGLSEYIVGNQNVNGVLLRYVKTELHDMTMRFSQAIDNQYAKALQLQYFVYQGTRKDTTRDFCNERVNKCYHRNDVDSWPKDLPYFPPNYNFYEDRGGYNCRHRIAWVSNEMGQRLRMTES